MKLHVDVDVVALDNGWIEHAARGLFDALRRIEFRDGVPVDPETGTLRPDLGRIDHGDRVRAGTKIHEGHDDDAWQDIEIDSWSGDGVALSRAGLSGTTVYAYSFSCSSRDRLRACAMTGVADTRDARGREQECHFGIRMNVADLTADADLAHDYAPARAALRLQEVEGRWTGRFTLRVRPRGLWHLASPALFVARPFIRRRLVTAVAKSCAAWGRFATSPPDLGPDPAARITREIFGRSQER